MITISASGSLHIRGLLTNCEGEPVQKDDLSAISFSVFEYLHPENTVADYTSLDVPLSAVLDTPAEDAHGAKYNIDFNPYIPGKPMFPKRQTSYIAEVVFWDTNGKPSAHQIQIDAI